MDVLPTVLDLLGIEAGGPHLSITGTGAAGTRVWAGLLQPVLAGQACESGTPPSGVEQGPGSRSDRIRAEVRS